MKRKYIKCVRGSSSWRFERKWDRISGNFHVSSISNQRWCKWAKWWWHWAMCEQHVCDDGASEMGGWSRVNVNKGSKHFTELCTHVNFSLFHLESFRVSTSRRSVDLTETNKRKSFTLIFSLLRSKLPAFDEFHIRISWWWCHDELCIMLTQSSGNE